MKNFLIYSSSAGSGKTFTLTKEYLKLILQIPKPDYFKKILAMTFTNDAAREMKARIIKELKSIASKGDESSEMLKEILNDLKIERETIQKRANLILYEILQDYNDFAIKTIDSFVNQVVSSFTIDLNLPYNYEIVLNTEEVIDEAVRNLIDRIGQENGLTEMFKAFALSKIEDDKGWNTLKDEIVKFARVIFQDQNAELIEKNEPLTLKDISHIRTKMKAYFSAEESKIQLLAREAMQVIDGRGLNENDFYQSNRGIYGFFKSLASIPADLFSAKAEKPNSYVIKTLQENYWYSPKQKNPLVDEISNELYDLGQQIIELKSEKYKILKAIYPNLLKIPFIAHIKSEIDQILNQRNQVVLADFNRKILDIVSQEPVPYIYERIGEKYNHILIDEFQDTADIQFFNILPLFENSLSKNFLNLIVGDPKQAIYSWRGGNVLLMIDLMNKTTEYLKRNVPDVQQNQVDSVMNNSKTKNLDYNFRSFENLIHFNNQFFDFLKKDLQTPVLQEVFSSAHQQISPKTKPGGYVEICNRQNVNLQDKYEQIEVLLPELIENILKDNFSQNDIAILCRKTDEGSRVAEILKARGYAVKSSDSLKLKNNLEVKFLISGLRLLLHPERRFDKFEFLEFFYLISKEDATKFDLKQTADLRFDSFLSHFKDNYNLDLSGVQGLSVYPAIEFLADRFNLFSNARATDYILKLLDIALDFSNKTSKNIADFLNYWSIQKDKVSVSSSFENSITVQTIHKSKGLEYKVVILPFVTWEMDTTEKNEIWLSLDTLDYEELKAENQKIESAPFGMKEEFEFCKDILIREKELNQIENLNLLYVAMTRAIERQYIWLWNKGNKSKIVAEGIGSHLHQFMETQEIEIVDTSRYFRFGKMESKLSPEKKAEPVNVAHISKLPVLKHHLKLNQGFAENDERIKTGNLVHFAFEKIYKKTDAEKALTELRNRYAVNDEQINFIRQQIDSVIHHPELAHLFEENAIAKNEAEILSSVSRVKRPDRLIFLDGKVFVLDYKTGEKRSSHARQLKEYKELLIQMGYQNIDLKLIYLDPLEIISVE